MLLFRNHLWVPPSDMPSAKSLQKAVTRAIRGSDGAIYYSNHNGPVPHDCEANVTTDWIVECPEIRYHWENCQIQLYQSDRKLHGLYIQPQTHWWHSNGCPVGRVSQTYLSLRVGGYLLDTWALEKPYFTPVHGSTCFIIHFDHFHNIPSKTKIQEAEFSPKGGGSLFMTFPRYSDSERFSITFQHLISDLDPRSCDNLLDRYAYRYQEFFLDMLRSKQGVLL